MAMLLTRVGSFFGNIWSSLSVWALLDILIVTFIIYELIQLTRKTRSFQVIKGLALLFVAYGVAQIIGLTTLLFFLDSVIKNVAVILVILFQPELRKVLEQLGRHTFLERRQISRVDDQQLVVENLVEAMVALSRRKVGALMVIERRTGLKDVLESGTIIDALVSVPLIENIFEPNTPLHDGAVIINDTRIVAAACVLPLTENHVSRELGTRHRAGLGMTETTDAVSLIVSEETGAMSIAQAGRLMRHLDAEELRRRLDDIYSIHREEKKGLSLWSLFRKKDE